ncbi:MAG: hypothetical protein US83_C0002G0112 [Candidatus Falkowbacteria bacterium GW2011_GWC2_38_22]|uniref:Cohesin domain-containing protein n=1 Tax=Candidatus Falkowbacteria bacterium GW2011_GWE1_38_31 TaxID=1618638 RepID=A0A0G0K5G4_9BACT|nr:MAG: hypothetical protein US73_C0007G0112 [Candidatus Falkowbacteria bacterium GW2011_GWF2_38_1205]KKQ62023.1 MAG: hypothetical protein US83_C0002G0112 [Candidatus Falkowbacteria bacterium GW2011_GWC2_38_22]KKQ63815.1 MAG: hypothetical protein US84_C0003G0005 [Candidatus Falkowbacteria bacterium GW2011_GWF1_38_22]KKQ66072.1 MAG: hypothetical protein US87_C0003G0005 [Candidatus Falkowbacteria bacterium GW2011_GWE2_38_254]KKQ70675.1 MAG: hypothetical protein US91_C0003G0005 [Candidatus Falkowb
MKNKKILYITKIFIWFIIFNISQNICNAETMPINTLHLSTDKSEFFSDSLTLFVHGNTIDSNINLVEIKLKYNQDDLIFDSIDYLTGFCELSLYEIIDNKNGEINFACATTNATTTQDIAKINFTKINSGFTNLSLADSKFYLNNGMGDSILPETEDFYYFLF